LEGFLLIGKGNIGFDSPWCEFRRMSHLARIVLDEAGAEIAGDADVEMVSV